MQPSIGNLLRELTRLYTQTQREYVTDGHDTSSTQSHVLMELGRAGLLTQQELGRRLSLDKGWVSRAVESLVQTGLVAKSRHDNDRRSRWLELTVKGKKHYQTLNESLDTHAEQMMQSLSMAQRQHIHQALILLIKGMQGAVPNDELLLLDDSASPASNMIIDHDTEEWAVMSTLLMSQEETQQAASESEAEMVVLEAELSAAMEAIVQPQARTVDHLAEQLTRPVSSLAEKARPPMPVAHTRIVGSKTLPTRPLFSRASPRVSRTALSEEERLPDEAMDKSRISASGTEHRTLTTARQTGSTFFHARPASPTTPAPQRTATVPTAAQPADTPRTGSLLHKLLTQGALFNKRRQREQPATQEWDEQRQPEELLPEDKIQFQPASPTDWNEIRNLLTANRLPVQGALNHLAHFIVATENGHVIGAIGMEVYNDIGLIRSLVVNTNMRGKSVAKRLLRALIERAYARQISALYLLSSHIDPLFLAHGFDKMPRVDLPTKLYVSAELQGASSSATIALRLIL